MKANKDLLARRGMSETLLGDIEVTIKSFEHTLEATRAGGRLDHRKRQRLLRRRGGH